jgi:hypothetical protein
VFKATLLDLYINTHQDVCCISTGFSAFGIDSIEGGPPAQVCATIYGSPLGRPGFTLQSDTGKIVVRQSAHK